MFVSSPRIANILGITCSVTTQFVAIYSSLQIYTLPFLVPVPFLFVPQMAFSRIYFYISLKCMESRCYQGFSELEGEALTAFRIFLFTAFLYPLLGVLLNNELFKGHLNCRRKRSKKESRIYQVDHQGDFESQGSLEGSGVNSDVVNEEARVELIKDVTQYPVIIKGVNKTYYKNGKPFQALKPTSLVISKGEVFGLLGPNGAGKTTLLTILTGIIKPDSGEAWIGGSHIITELPNVYKSIGVCPQFDIFWEDLTIEEHLLFYMRLKGAGSKEEERESVESVCREVDLFEHKEKRAKSLSGGMKRRLSLAISLIGNPDAIFLDEPTTGLDPLNREIFWAIIENIKKNKSIILTTHLMQEADYLSDRIGRHK